MRLVTLVSGGLDSVTLAYYLANQGNEQVFLFINYGQRHLKEHASACKCAENLGIPLKHITITGEGVFKSALTDRKLEIPSGEYAPENLAITVVPNRNSVMANLAAALALSLNFDGVALAVHAGDHEVYPDCRPEFIEALENLLSIITGREQRRLSVVASFVNKSKAEVVALGAKLGVPFEKTWSCYVGGKWHCGVCSTCQERKKAFAEAGVSDPTRYEK